MRRLGIRGRLLLLVIAAVATALVVLVVGFNLILDSTLDSSSRDLARSRAGAESSLVRTAGGSLRISDGPDDTASDALIWVFANGRTLEHPRVSTEVNVTARTLETGPSRFADIAAADIRLYSRPILVGGHRAGTVVAGVSLAPYEETRRVTLLASLALGVIVLILVALAARWSLASSLRPVRRMTRQAAAWSDRDLDHRFALGEPHDELTELAATLDGLLDRLAASLRREQRFSAELSHELRTPLARVLAETELALRRDREPADYRDVLELIQGNALQLTRTLDTLLAAARHETGSARGTADSAAVAELALEEIRHLADERHVELDLAAPAQTLRVGVEAELAARILQPVLENAIRYGKSRVRVSITRARGAIRYTVDDDGPGVAAGEEERIFEPGVRGRVGEANGTAGSGLGLSLARRLVESVSGDIEAEPDAAGGRFVVELPAG
ncbi:MAG TPA: ATP-binding protein [Gaiellaceae bacterium]|jgi:signal transduction histidine kinase|nr:ATP-binding protein [Gaiellaceae bacterium]